MMENTFNPKVWVFIRWKDYVNLSDMPLQYPEFNSSIQQISLKGYEEIRLDIIKERATSLLEIQLIKPKDHAYSPY